MVNNDDCSANWIHSVSACIGRHFTINRMLTMGSSVRLRLEREQPLTFSINYDRKGHRFAQLFKRYGCTLQLGV